MDNKEGEIMTAAQQRNVRLIETIDRAEQSALDALRKFLDTIDDAVPHLSEDKPRRRALDSLFEMIEQLVATATGLAKSLVELTQEASEAGRKAAAPRKKAARPAKVAKATKASKATRPVKKAGVTKKTAAKANASTR